LTFYCGYDAFALFSFGHFATLQSDSLTIRGLPLRSLFRLALLLRCHATYSHSGFPTHRLIPFGHYSFAVISLHSFPHSGSYFRLAILFIVLLNLSFYSLQWISYAYSRSISGLIQLLCCLFYPSILLSIYLIGYFSVLKKGNRIALRAKVNDSLITGIGLVDSLLPVGRGQRQLILGDRSTGKTSIYLTCILVSLTTSAITTLDGLGSRRLFMVYVAINQNLSKISTIINKVGNI